MLDAAAKSEISSQMKELAEAMYHRGLMHADLNQFNVFWDLATHQATVIDFGNGQDLHAAPKYQKEVGA